MHKLRKQKNAVGLFDSFQKLMVVMMMVMTIIIVMMMMMMNILFLDSLTRRTCARAHTHVPSAVRT